MDFQDGVGNQRLRCHIDKVFNHRLCQEKITQSSRPGASVYHSACRSACWRFALGGFHQANGEGCSGFPCDLQSSTAVWYLRISGIFIRLCFNSSYCSLLIASFCKTPAAVTDARPVDCAVLPADQPSRRYQSEGQTLQLPVPVTVRGPYFVPA